MSHLIDSLTTVIQNLYVVTGLLGIVLAMAIESCCIPLPSEIVMPLAGFMVASHKQLLGLDPQAPLWLNLLLLALAGSLGCLIGSIAAYGIGYAGGRPLMLKYGRYVLISQHDADKADHFFQRWGAQTAFFFALAPGGAHLHLSTRRYDENVFRQILSLYVPRFTALVFAAGLLRLSAGE